jgi:hypothetical protein
VETFWELPYPEPEDFGLPGDRGTLSVGIENRHRPGDRLWVKVAWLEEGSSHESDRTVVLELRDPGGEVIERSAQAIGRLTEWPMFEIAVQVPGVVPAGYVARLEIHGPEVPDRVFEWPVEVPDPSLAVAAELELSATFAAPGEALELTLRNTGPAPIAYGDGFELERRLEDGTGWRSVPHEGMELMILRTLEPGESRLRHVEIPRWTRPGRHRIVKDVGSQWARGTARPSVEFDVVPRTSH